jgi:hypothetical protein
MSTRKFLPGMTASIAAAIGLGVTAYGLSTTARAQSLLACSAETVPGTVCKCTLSSLHPMQAAVGILEVEKRVEKIKALIRDNKLEHYEQCRRVPVVIGPNDPSGNPQFYLTDHHHLARALLDAGESATECIIEESHNALSDAAFGDLMTKKKKAWLFNAEGNPVTWQQLPKSLQELQDDAYRSLAGAVEKQDGFCKPSGDFGEFQWANFFRTHGSDGQPPGPVATKDEIENNLKKAAKKATDLAHSDVAETLLLPGYWKDKPPPQCEPKPPPGCEND